MSNGYLVAAAADLAAAHEIAEGFGLDVIDASSVHDRPTTSAALADAANVGLILSEAAASDEAFVALLGELTTRLRSAQLILVTLEARAAFAFLPDAWPAMSFEEARSRSFALLRSRRAETNSMQAQTQEHAPSDVAASQAAPDLQADDKSAATQPHEAHQGEPREDAPAAEQSHAAGPPPDEAQGADDNERPSAAALPRTERPAAAALPRTMPPEAGPPQAASATAPQIHVEHDRVAEEPERGAGTTHERQAGIAAAPSVPADATAFAPNRLRRGTPELVRIVVHQPKDLNAVIKAARQIDPRTESGPQGMPLGDVAVGARIGVALDVRGAACDGTVQRRKWSGEPIDFSFAIEAEAGVKQVVLLARVFIDDAQVGVLAFTRKVSGPAKKPHGPGDRARLRRHKRVFLSYASRDREIVSAIATAYRRAGVEHFWDRASLKSGEEWHPRLRREIDRADLFHLCWSRAAAGSEWVQKEAEHALMRRRRHSGKPEITVQMLDGPPWAPHPPSLDAINFDDFVRAAIVGYARGDGS